MICAQGGTAGGVREQYCSPTEFEDCSLDCLKEKKMSEQCNHPGTEAAVPSRAQAQAGVHGASREEGKGQSQPSLGIWALSGQYPCWGSLHIFWASLLQLQYSLGWSLTSKLFCLQVPMSMYLIYFMENNTGRIKRFFLFVFFLCVKATLYSFYPFTKRWEGRPNISQMCTFISNDIVYFSVHLA